jgi:hypothetical protein
MKQAGIVAVLAVFLGFMAYADDYVIAEDEFRLLTPEQQVQLLLSEWKDEFYLTGLSRLYGRHYPSLLENAEAVKKILLRYLEEIEVPVQYTTEDRTFEILEQLIFGILFYSWTADERMKLTELYRDKIDWYLRTYKVVDFTVLRFDARIRGLNPEWGGMGIYLFLPEITIESLFEKYTGIGYEGLRLPSPEHLVRQYLADRKYTRGRNDMALRRQEEIITKGGETMKPAILQCFKEIGIPRRLEGVDRTYWLLFSLIFEHQAFRDLWTREERMELAELYREKIDWYLRTYDVSDFVPRNFESIIRALLLDGEIVF